MRTLGSIVMILGILFLGYISVLFLFEAEYTGDRGLYAIGAAIAGIGFLFGGIALGQQSK